MCHGVKMRKLIEITLTTISPECQFYLNILQRLTFLNKTMFTNTLHLLPLFAQKETIV